MSDREPTTNAHAEPPSPAVHRESRASRTMRAAIHMLRAAPPPPPDEAPHAGGGTLETMSAPVFRAIVAGRLRALERDLAEVRNRVNGLLFVVAGAVITQLIIRLL